MYIYIYIYIFIYVCLQVVRAPKRTCSSKAAGRARRAKAGPAPTPIAGLGGPIVDATPPWRRRGMAPAPLATNPWASVASVTPQAAPVLAASPFATVAAAAPVPQEDTPRVAPWWGAASDLPWPTLEHCYVKMIDRLHLHGSQLATARVCKAGPYLLDPVSERAGSCEHDLCSHELMRVANCHNTFDAMSRAIRDIVPAAQIHPSPWSAAIVGRDGMLAAFLLADAFTWHDAACTISFENGCEYAAHAGCGCENHVMVLQAAKMLMRAKMWYGFGYPEGPALHYNKYMYLPLLSLYYVYMLVLYIYTPSYTFYIYMEYKYIYHIFIYIYIYVYMNRFTYLAVTS